MHDIQSNSFPSKKKTASEPAKFRSSIVGNSAHDLSDKFSMNNMQSITQY